MAGEITDAEYNTETGRIEWVGVTKDGTEVSGQLNKRMWGPNTELSEGAMKDVADQLPNTPLYNDGPFDPETLPSIGLEDYLCPPS